MKFSNVTYDRLKWVALIALPSLSVLYLALAALWHLPKPQEVAGTIMAIDTFLGALLGISAKNYNPPTPATDGALEVAEDDERLIARLDLQTHPEELAKKDVIVLDVKRVPMEPEEPATPPQ